MGEIYGAVESRSGDSFMLLTTDGGTEEIEATGVAYCRVDDADAARSVSLLRSIQEDRLRGDRATGWLRLEYPARRRWETLDALMRAGVHTYEADVWPLRRYLSERDDLKFASSGTRDLLYDLEVDPRVSFADQLAGKARIMLVSWWSRAGGGPGRSLLQAWDDEAERDMLRRFLAVARDHHVLSAWNGRRYDQIVIRARAAELGLDVEWWRWTFLDMLDCTAKHFARGESGEQKVSLALDAIGETVLGKPKLDLRDMLRDAGLQPPAYGPAFYYAWEKAPHILELYGGRDVEIMNDLEERKHFVALQKQLAALCRCIPDDRSLRATALADGVFLRLGAKRGVHFANKPKVDGDEDFEQAAGPTVLKVTPGAHDRVYMFDFAAMYSTIILSLNASPECLVPADSPLPKIMAPNGAYFRIDRVGCFPQVIEQFLARRLEAKALSKAAATAAEQLDLMVLSDSLKVFCNSMYGVLLSRFSRYYSEPAGQAVLSTSRVLFGLMVAAIREHGGREVMGDTDGAGGTDGNPEAALADANARVQAWAREVGLPRCKFDIEWETTWEAPPRQRAAREARGEAPIGLIIAATKHYAGVATYYKGAHLDVPKLEVKGLTSARSDGIRLARREQRRVLEQVLLEGLGADEVRRGLLATRQALLDRRVGVHDLVRAQSLSKHPDEYEQEVPHVRIARQLLARGIPVFVGFKIPYVVVGHEQGRHKVVHVDEFDGQYDGAYVWNEMVVPHLVDVLNAAWPRIDWKATLRVRKGDASQALLFEEPPVMRRDLVVAGPPPVVVVTFTQAAGREEMAAARDLVERTPGRSPVQLVVCTEAGLVDVDLGEGWRCDATALQAALIAEPIEGVQTAIR